MSKKKNHRAEPAVEAEVEQVTPEVEVPVHEDQPKFTVGKITGCYSLNVREHPDTKADVLCSLPASTEVQVDMSNDYVDWYHVNANGVDGFCMKKYISINH